jgi:hypothetical protein
MNILVVRDDCNDRRTFGTMTFPDGYVCQTLEDVVRPSGVKVVHETAIEPGTYPVTVTMSRRFGKMLPLISGVNMYEGVRIHAGNRVSDTSGCLLVGVERGPYDNLIHSRVAMEQVQKRIAEALVSPSGVCTITITQPRVETTETFRAA